MQLKGLVSFFTGLLILICIYQLSFTWIVRSYEKDIDKKVDKWLSTSYQKPEQKYPGNKALQDIYADSLNDIRKAKVSYQLDSLKDYSTGHFGYKNAKASELLLGLDLQGGMSVTMEVGLDGLIHSLSNYSKDPAFTTALNAAVIKKANSNADLISLFGGEYEKANPNGKLAPLFSARSNNKIKFDASNKAVLDYLRKEAEGAFNNTLRIISSRIDRFGVASPTINPNPAKGTITIELAGVNDPERIRRNLQSTANLQFFEVYNVDELREPIMSTKTTLADLLSGRATTDTTKTKDSTAVVSNIINNKSSLDSIAVFAQGQQAENGSVLFPAHIAYVHKKDTATLNAYLRMDIIKSKFSPNTVFMYGKQETDNVNPKTKNIFTLYAIKTLENGLAKLDGEHVSEARQDYDEKGRVAIKMTMDQVGTHIWADMTKNNIGKPIAIVLDNIVYSAPFVNSIIPNGSSEITGNYTINEAQDMANVLQSGKLPAPAKIVQEQIVGPTLGNQAISGGAMAFGIAFIVIFALMLLYFNTAGWIANIALILNLIFTIGILSMFNYTLTAPGIAGLVLTIGMAVDTNVIIFERIKEELTRGKSYANAVSDGYKRSYAPVFDAHVTTLLTAFILFYFGLGPVLGFATTQIIGILLSLFCGILVSRLISDMYTKKDRHFNYFTSISKKIFKHTEFKFIEYRKVAYVISGVVLVLGIAALFNGFDEGVDFSGGRSYTVTFHQAPDQEAIRNDLKAVFGEYPIVKTVDKATQLNITTSYMIHETGNNVDSIVENKLYQGLVKYLPTGTSLKDFSVKHKQSSQTVLPTISADLRSGATKATLLAILAICLYIFIRFRDWRFSVGTIFSLLHDVFVTLAVFSFLRNVVPFPLEIDQHFIAAILTVIGFSMNDTIIVYDRIREDSKLMKGQDKATIINKAINQTLSRTIMTSLTVFLTILILFIFGGEVTRGFSFAMLIGVLTGTYSSIFVAAPILVDFAKNKPLGKQEEPTKKQTTA